MVSKLNIPGSEFDISIAQVKPHFPPGLNLKAVGVSHKNNLIFNSETIMLTPHLLTLLSSRASFSVEGKVNEGLIDGRVHMPGGDLDKPIKLDLDLTGIQIKPNAVLRNQLNLNVSGIIDGNIKITSNQFLSGILTAKLVIKNCKVEILSGILNTKLLEFTNIKTDLSVDEKKIDIKNCAFQGDQIDGWVSGTITLMTPWSKSLLNLKGSIQPKRQFLKDLMGSFPGNMASKKRQNNNRLPIRFGGTIDKPTLF
jgi:type II secretion system protein N